MVGARVPAGEGAGASLYVVLGVVELVVHADAKGEQFQQLTAIVLVDRRLVALDVVQVVQHRRVSGQPQQQFLEVAHALLAEGVVLHGGGAGVVYLVVSGAEDGVPEEGHLLLELVLVVDHAVDDFGLARLDSGLVEVGRVGAIHQVFFDAGIVGGVQQLVNDAVVALVRTGFDLVPAGAETGPPQQVGHQGDFLLGNFVVGHLFLLIFGCSSLFSARPPGFRLRNPARTLAPGCLTESNSGQAKPAGLLTHNSHIHLSLWAMRCQY